MSGMEIMINMTNLQVGSCHWGKTCIINVLGVGLGITRTDSTEKEGPVKSINVPLDSKTQANSKSDCPCPNGFCIQTSSLVFLVFCCHMSTITYNAQKHGTVETVGTLETVETVPGVLNLQNFARNYIGNLINYLDIFRNYMENLRYYMEKFRILLRL